MMCKVIVRLVIDSFLIPCNRSDQLWCLLKRTECLDHHLARKGRAVVKHACEQRGPLQFRNTIQGPLHRRPILYTRAEIKT